MLSLPLHVFENLKKLCCTVGAGVFQERYALKTAHSKRQLTNRLCSGQFSFSTQLINWTKSSDDVAVQNSVFSLIGCHLRSKIDLRTLESSVGNASEIYNVSRHGINNEIEKLKHLQQQTGHYFIVFLPPCEISFTGNLRGIHSDYIFSIFSSCVWQKKFWKYKTWYIEVNTA